MMGSRGATNSTALEVEVAVIVGFAVLTSGDGVGVAVRVGVLVGVAVGFGVWVTEGVNVGVSEPGSFIR
jgi:hypothetical protein